MKIHDIYPFPGAIKICCEKMTIKGNDKKSGEKRYWVCLKQLISVLDCKY
jgi:hypothetical protein